jgi:phosphatidate phosphatase APP1
VIQLKKIKQGLADFLFTGGGSHDHKFHKIKSILEFYPELRFVLLGDDSQKDPYIYERIVKMFPMNVRAIYIRQTMSKKKSAVVNLLKNVENMGVAVCYFEQSAQAKEHSLAIGLVKSSS